MTYRLKGHTSLAAARKKRGEQLRGGLWASDHEGELRANGARARPPPGVTPAPPASLRLEDAHRDSARERRAPRAGGALPRGPLGLCPGHRPRGVGACDGAQRPTLSARAGVLAERDGAGPVAEGGAALGEGAAERTVAFALVGRAVPRMWHTGHRAAVQVRPEEVVKRHRRCRCVAQSLLQRAPVVVRFMNIALGNPPAVPAYCTTIPASYSPHTSSRPIHCPGTRGRCSEAHS